jgi:nitrogen regulatory protein PII
MIIPDEKLDLAVKTIKDNARTEVGEGVIAVSNLENYLNITTNITTVDD